MNAPELRVVDAELARADHADAIVELIDAYASEPMGGAKPLSREVKQALIPALKLHPTTCALLALAGDEPVGVAICFLGFSTFAARPLLNIHDLAVRADWRRRGVGRRLLRASAEKARGLGCCRLTLEVRADNVPARRLYEQEGFRNDWADTQTLFVSRLL